MVSEQSIYVFDTIYSLCLSLKWYLNNSFFGIGITIAKGTIHPPPVGGGLLYPLTPRVKLVAVIETEGYGRKL